MQKKPYQFNIVKLKCGACILCHHDIKFVFGTKTSLVNAHFQHCQALSLDTWYTLEHSFPVLREFSQKSEPSLSTVGVTSRATPAASLEYQPKRSTYSTVLLLCLQWTVGSLKCAYHRDRETPFTVQLFEIITINNPGEQLLDLISYNLSN